MRKTVSKVPPADLEFECAFQGTALPIAILMSSAVRSPISRLCLRRTYVAIISSILLPPVHSDLQTTMLFCAMTATSDVPAPTSTIMFPDALEIGTFAPMAAARSAGIKWTSLAPAWIVASSMAPLSTSVTPAGTDTMATGSDTEYLPTTFPMKYRSIASVIPYSATIPSRMGRLTTIRPGERPSICLACEPTATTR